MSWNRYAKRTDVTQERIVKALRDAGCQVYLIGQPCDLLVRYWSNVFRLFMWQTMECKTPYGKKDPKARVDKRQEDQALFLQQTGTPIVLTPDQALRLVGAL